MYLAVLINSMFLAFVTSHHMGRDAYILPAMLVVLIAVRLVVWHMRRHEHTQTIDDMRRSMATTVMVAAATALGLSLWTLNLLAHGDAPEHTYIAMFTALCTISCAACLSSVPLAAYGVVAIGTLPISVSLLASGNMILMSMGANLLLLSPLVIGMVYRQHRQLRRVVGSRTDMAAEKFKVSELAYRDPLTGLANRRAFLDELKGMSAGAGQHALAVGMVDLDGFKVINDTYGHHTGDALLVETARRFQQLDIGDAMVARLGGDEFAVLLRDVANLEDARLRLATLAHSFEQPFIVGLQAFRLTASIGLAHSMGDSATDLELVNRADLAMYESKRSPSATICLFEPGMEAQTRRRIMIEQALGTHEDNELIELHYQPVIDTATNRITAFEALARWTHPVLGVISPAEFIPLAEQAGMTEPMTAHLLSMALRTASTWPDHIGLSFNLSAGELGSPDVAKRLLEIIKRHNFDPRRLSIEVTETAFLSDFESARIALGVLQAGGVRILLDDFGAGYASIGYLRQIRFDGIKLDGSLIATMLESTAAHDLLIGVLRLCEAIGTPVTAEMVETQAQHDLLCALGVDKLQGYFLSRPLPARQTLAACSEHPARKRRARAALQMVGNVLRREPGMMN